MARLFVDREAELKSLDNACKGKDGSLMAIYGQRRVGKSALISEFLKGRRHVYHQATADSETEQLRVLSNRIGRAIGNDILAEHGATDWLMLLRVASSYAGRERLCIAIDEFPYLARLKPSLPSIFQAAWDQYLSKANVALILSGSSISMIRGEVLDYSAPLYGRARLVLKLRPLGFRYVAMLIPRLKFVEKLYTYFVFGGVPSYYAQIGGYSTFDRIIEFVLGSGDTFYSEISLLLSEEVRKDAKFIEVLSLIAEGVNKPSEIASKAHILQSNLYYYLNVLEELDMVSKEFPLLGQRKMRSKKSSYVVKNPFVKFWALVMKPVRDYVQQGDAKTALDDALSITESLAQSRFEEFAIEFLGDYMSKNIFKAERVGRWRGSNPRKPNGMGEEEIDVVALNEKTHDILFAECKWTGSPVGIVVYKDLKRKAALVQWHNADRDEHYALFSKSGFTSEMREAARDERVLLFDLKAIEKALG